MKKMLHSIKALIIATVLILAGVNLNAQNICAATNTISPAAIQNVCIGSPSNQLTATIATTGSGNNGNITYTWYSNTTNSTTGGTIVQTLSTTTGVTINSFTPPASVAGTLWYYCTVSNDGGDCAGTIYTTATVQVNVNTLPKIFNVSGGGARCSNGGGVSIILNNSETGVKYQLVRDGSPVGTPLSGTTGRPLGFSVTTAGTFTMLATNISTGCSTNMNGSAIVTINPIPTVSFSKTDVSCQGADGSITVTANGGAPAYLFNINGGSFSSNNNFTGLSAGNYPISVKDANSCIVNISATIANAAPLSVGISQINPGGCSGNDGSITVSRIGGVDDGITPVQFKLDGDVARPYQTSNVFGGLSKGNYTVTVEDSKGCTGVSSTVTLTQNSGTAPTIFNVTGGGTRCSNGSGVSIYLSGSQTGVDYQLQLGGAPLGTILHGSGNPLSFLLNNAGTYSIVATNTTAGCTSTMNGAATIIVNPAPSVYNVTGGGTRCSNGPGVSIYLSGSQVGVNYQLEKNGGPVGTILSGTGSQLGFAVSNSGTYTIQATNATTGCIIMMNNSAVIVTNPAPNLFTVSGGGVSCGTNAVSITLSGSEAGVSYQLNNSGFPVGTALQGNGSPLSFLTSTPGTYKILATNSSTGCAAFMTGSVVSSQDPPLTPSYTKYYASSCVGGDGTITITPGGGMPGYMYSVDDGPFGTNNFLTGLAAGDHKVVIKDASSCTFTYDAITVLTAPIMKVTANVTPASSCNGNDGSIKGLYYGGVVDGITPLQYKLDGDDATRPFQTNNTFNGLSAGNYVITIKDSKGCLAESSTIVLGTAAPVTFIPASYSTDVSSCGNGSDANIAVGVSGGVPPYDFKLNGTDYGNSNVPFFGFPNLGTGTYTVTVSDLHNCTTTQVFTIGQASSPVAKIAYNGDETCIGKNNGYISLASTGIGGIPGYSYSKDGGATYQSSNSFTNLSPATYSMVVKDSKGCVSAPVSITVRASMVSCRVGNALDNGTENRIGNSNDNSDLSKSSFNSSLSVQAYPNPFGSEFTLNVRGNNQDRVFITVTDILGRKLYQAEGSANQQYKLGNNLGRGIFIVQVLQGENIQTIKIVKE